MAHLQWLLQLFPFQVDEVICGFCVSLFSLVCFVCIGEIFVPRVCSLQSLTLGTRSVFCSCFPTFAPCWKYYNPGVTLDSESKCNEVLDHGGEPIPMLTVMWPDRKLNPSPPRSIPGALTTELYGQGYMAYLGGFDPSTSLRTSEVRCKDYTTQHEPHIIPVELGVIERVCVELLNEVVQCT